MRNRSRASFLLQTLVGNRAQGSPLRASLNLTDLFAESPASDFVSRRSPVAPYSQAAFHAANNWLSKCLGKHDQCGQARNLALPTRVLDILPSGDAVALYTPVASAAGQYACLSYCWGGDQELVLTQASLGTLHNGVPLGVLGKTIQDAIEVTRRLGLRYLWVDALCIIQDSDEDKDTELSRMSEVYLNSTVTIAAADADSSTGGFLQADDSSEQELVFEVPFGNGSIMLYPDSSMPQPMRLEDYHLSTRAWTLQEMLLSPRILFYTRTELLWICEEDYLKQISPTKYDYETSMSAHSSWRTILDKVKTGEAFWDEWLDLVKFYTLRQMTFDHDRLRAIQALIDTVQAISGQRCLHGMWERSLPYAFSWYAVAGRSNPSSHRSPLGAPTWSWASINDPVSSFICATKESVSVRLFRIREDHALGLEAIIIPASHAHEKPLSTPTQVGEGYFPDLANQPTDEDGTEDFFYMLVDIIPRAALFLRIVGTRGDVFLRTGLLVCHGPFPEQYTDFIYSYKPERIWLA